jgi:hypothetical protein
MALFIRQNEERSELQQRIAAELQEKAKLKADIHNDVVDGVEDSSYLKDTKQTTSLAWVWILIVLLAIGVLIYFIARANR